MITRSKKIHQAWVFFEQFFGDLAVTLVAFEDNQPSRVPIQRDNCHYLMYRKSLAYTIIMKREYSLPYIYWRFYVC